MADTIRNNRRINRKTLIKLTRNAVIPIIFLVCFSEKIDDIFSEYLRT